MKLSEAFFCLAIASPGIAAVADSVDTIVNGDSGSFYKTAREIRQDEGLNLLQGVCGTAWIGAVGFAAAVAEGARRERRRAAGRDDFRV
jgi:hypothetical protein